MFRLYEWNFSSTIELVTAILLVGTILAAALLPLIPLCATRSVFSPIRTLWPI